MVENEYEVISLNSEFLSRHKMLDQQIKKEKQRILHMKKNHIIIDLTLSAVLIGVFAYLIIIAMESTLIEFEFYMNMANGVSFVCGILTMCLLACSAATIA